LDVGTTKRQPLGSSGGVRCAAGGIEIEPDFADEWQGQHPEATLIQSDMRLLGLRKLL